MNVRENFWTAVFRWWENQSRIRVQIEGSSGHELTYTAIVQSIDGEAITLEIVETGVRYKMDFSNAELRAHSVEPIESVVSFGAAWADDSNSVVCFLTELREFGKPN